ncbi:hypothetical protein [Qipengyuania atrilutea]|uniref:TonB C-terminal domain-containing protein n=1 Tax=Qipengyuania atrilutea TaxID=2744473 RepID=A0A850H0S1_9SPHN|nr:hypothetical protein [Actirhodobacter atriluteus]NVD45501.1 hypothetical protein [Actirhodobacter atriluteus]
MSADSTRFSSTRRKPNPWVIAVVAIVHLGLFYGFVRALAPGAVQSIERSVVSTFTVTVTAPEDPPPPPPAPEPQPDEGAQGDPGREAVPQLVTAPSPAIQLREDEPLPRASSTGTASTSGATDRGTGTGAAGEGTGTGAGRAGSGLGGVAVTKPQKIAGDISSAADYPTPPGGRKIRRGQSVDIAMTVGVDGRASNCRILSPSPDPEADRITCELAVERFRFLPARDANGDPVPATYAWRQRWGVNLR